MVVTLGHRMVGDVASATAGNQNLAPIFAVEKQTSRPLAGCVDGGKRVATPTTTTSLGCTTWLEGTPRGPKNSPDWPVIAGGATKVCGDKVDRSRNDLQPFR